MEADTALVAIRPTSNESVLLRSALWTASGLSGRTGAAVPPPVAMAPASDFESLPRWQTMVARSVLAPTHRTVIAWTKIVLSTASGRPGRTGAPAQLHAEMAHPVAIA